MKTPRVYRPEKGPNSHKIILSLFDLSMEWCKPYIDAGYTVIPLDLQADGIDLMEVDIPELAYDIIGDKCGLPPFHVYGILNAIPCQDFSSSGARWMKAKDENGITEKSVELLKKSMQITKYFCYSKRTDTIAEFDAKEALALNPDAGLKFWAMENPVGRINSLIPEMKAFGPRYFQPHHYGSPYTKKTGLWGMFTFPEPTNNVEPTEGSRMWHMFPTKDPQDRKNARSKTDSNFAKAFYQKNQ